MYADFLRQTHLLIAGATGAGKSTVVNGMVHAAMFHSPATVQFILIDPKGTELDEYKSLPHTLCYADMTHGMDAIINALEYAMQIYRDRMSYMKRRHLREWDGGDIYVIIDELMILMTRAKRKILPILQDLLSLTRCAKIHIVGCTQSPINAVLPTELKCNWNSRLALRTVSAQDSRNIIGVKGCEDFPNPVTDHMAFGAYRHGAEIEVYKLPMIEDAERQKLIDYWTRQRKSIFSLFGR